MAMTKKEIEAYEAALTAAALRSTSDVAPDVQPPETFDELSKGWALVGEGGDYPRVEQACSSRASHAIGRTDKTNSQRPRSLYSTKLIALRALRCAVEKNAARQLRKIDKMIEAEDGAP